ncbi:ABC transporter permease [Dactylosporangium sp. AC04546]|uniref:ABC transporter permease n=1 Tax=Dactylosporangium sp. AC04546 TaxID=2862460 RepID=UPI001EDD6ACE|nr:ABC transporter permease [Dactylosporangium sp. AC04546]WVK79327.1 ABC transporter permease [Dactylosporangium sp. AC04546]
MSTVAEAEKVALSTVAPPRRRSVRLWRALPPVGVFALIIGGWYVISYLVLDDARRFLLPPPHEIVDVGFLDPRNLENLMHGLWLTTEVALLGLAIAIVVGVTAAVLMSQAKWLEISVYPWVVILQTIPILALVPLIAQWTGFGFSSRLLVCVLIALFPIIANTLFGLQSADAGLRDLFRLHGAGRLTLLVKLMFPASLPAMFAGFRISAGLSVIGALVGDLFFKQGEPGLGILIDVYRARLQSEQMYAAVFLASLLGIAVFLFFGWLGRRVVGKWYQASRG